MGHTVTAKLNREARRHDSEHGSTFFVSLGEKNYNFSTKENEWTNYDAALFAKGGQVDFYQENLVKGAIVTVTGTGIILKMPDDPQYSPVLQIQDAKLTSMFNDGAPQAAGQPSPQPAQQPSPAAPQQDGGFNDFDTDIPF